MVHLNGRSSSIRRTDQAWGYVLDGSRDELIELGEVLPEWIDFAEERDGRGRRVRTRRLCKMDQRRLTIRDEGRGRFSVWVYFTSEEQAENDRRRAEQASREREEQMEQARKESLPKSENEYRTRALMMAEVLEYTVEACARDGYGEFRFDSETVDACVKARLALVAALKRGRVISEGQPKRPALRLIRGDCAPLHSD